VALGPAFIGRFAILEGGRLQPRRVEILDLVAGNDAAGETADAGIVPRPRNIPHLGERAGSFEQRKDNGECEG
jgi:hypothetical protein